MSKFSSIFSQLLPLISKVDFRAAVAETNAERHQRGFSSWSQCVAMLFCQLAHAHSLREIGGGLASCEGRLQHLGVEGAPKRSTLSYANEHRPWEMYQNLYYKTLTRLSGEFAGAGRQGRLRSKSKLFLLDASVIDLCIDVFDWAKFRRTKGAVKLHCLLDCDGYLPSYAVLTTGEAHEINVARRIEFERGTTVVFDRGDVDYAWYGELYRKGVILVTCLKSNAAYRVVYERELPPRGHVVRDEVIRLTGQKARDCDYLLRRIEVKDPATGETTVFLSNALHLGSTTIAALYKERWQIELFFKALQQNLKLKTFLGTTFNAVQTQIWTARLVMLLLKYLPLKSRHGWSLSNLVALLRMNLFVYRSLWEWLDQPDSQPQLPQVVQTKLAFG